MTNQENLAQGPDQSSPTQPVNENAQTKKNTRKANWALWVAIASACITGINGYLNYCNNRQTQQNWAKISEANIVLSKIEFVNVSSFPCDSTVTFFGYENPLTAKDYVSGKCNLYSYLEAFSDSNRRIPIKLNRVFTVKQMNEELKNQNYKGTAYGKKMQILQFVFRNTGKTDATNVSYKIQMTNEKGIWQTITNDSSGAKVIPHDSDPSNYITVFGVPVEFEFPDSINFKVECTYQLSDGTFRKNNWNQVWVKQLFAVFDN